MLLVFNIKNSGKLSYFKLIRTRKHLKIKHPKIPNIRRILIKIRCDILLIYSNLIKY